jgi:predicted  nucleic acid-binding Zn-ribbon protein
MEQKVREKTILFQKKERGLQQPLHQSLLSSFEKKKKKKERFVVGSF